MIERKIIQVDESVPLISEKKKKQSIIAFGLVITGVVILIMSLILLTGEKVVKISDYTLATVASGSLIQLTEASGTVVLPIQVSIGSLDDGYADKLFVKVGDKIDKTTVLAKLDVPDLEKDLIDIEKTLITDNLTLDQIKLELEFSVKENELELSRLEKDILEAKEDLDRAKELKELKSSRESDFEDALEIYENLENEKEDLLLSIEKNKRGGVLDIKSQEAQISKDEASRDRIINDIESSKIKSPIKGTILTVEDQLNVPGSQIDEGTELFTVADTSSVYIDLEVYEEYKAALKIGGMMDILVSSKLISAEIIEIGNVASLSSDSLASTIVVRAKPTSNIELTSGASAVANIPLGVKENALLLPRGSYLTTGNQKYIYKIVGKKAVKTEVVFGTIEGAQVEVLSGVEIGDRIITSSYQSFIDKREIEIK